MSNQNQLPVYNGQVGNIVGKGTIAVADRTTDSSNLLNFNTPIFSGYTGNVVGYGSVPIGTKEGNKTFTSVIHDRSTNIFSAFDRNKK